MDDVLKYNLLILGFISMNIFKLRMNTDFFFPANSVYVSLITRREPNDGQFADSAAYRWLNKPYWKPSTAGMESFDALAISFTTRCGGRRCRVVYPNVDSNARSRHQSHNTLVPVG